MLIATPIKRDVDDSEIIDVMLYEQGEYRHPLLVVTDYEAGNFLVNLYNCLSAKHQVSILQQLNKLKPKLDEGE